MLPRLKRQTSPLQWLPDLGQSSQRWWSNVVFIMKRLVVLCFLALLVFWFPLEQANVCQNSNLFGKTQVVSGFFSAALSWRHKNHICCCHVHVMFHMCYGISMLTILGTALKCQKPRRLTSTPVNSTVDSWLPGSWRICQSGMWVCRAFWFSQSWTRHVALEPCWEDEGLPAGKRDTQQAALCGRAV